MSSARIRVESQDRILTEGLRMFADSRGIPLKEELSALPTLRRSRVPSAGTSAAAGIRRQYAPRTQGKSNPEPTGR